MQPAAAAPSVESIKPVAGGSDGGVSPLNKPYYMTGPLRDVLNSKAWLPVRAGYFRDCQSAPLVSNAHNGDLAMHISRTLLFVIGCFFATHVVAQMPQGEYLDGKDSKIAVVLAHGRVNSPDGNVVGPLRRAIHRGLGFHTLSLEMPDPGADSPASPKMAAAFPEAYQRIEAAIDYLKKDKGVQRIHLMGHSMGGRMTSGFLANHPDAGIVGFIGVGLTAGGKEPVNTNQI